MTVTAGYTPATPAPTAGTTNSGHRVEALVREAHAHLARTGAHMSPSKVSRLIRGYQSDDQAKRDSVSLTRWLEVRDRVNGYVDTTGGTAAYRADMRGGRQ